MTSTRTVLGPLTTTFTYPSSCSVAVEACDGCSSGWQAQTCSDNGYNDQGIQDNVECWPPRSNSDLSTGVALNGWGFYSPGLYCPAGYSTACSATGGVHGGFTFQYPLEQAETAIGCCPTGFTCDYTLGPKQYQTCRSVYFTGSFPAIFCSSGTSNDFRYQTVPATFSAVASSVAEEIVVSGYIIKAPLIQLNYMSTDLPVSTVPPTAMATSTTATATSKQVTATSMITSANKSTSAGLSTGAKAGIGVGAALGALALIVVAVWLVLRGRKRTHGHSQYAQDRVRTGRHELSPEARPHELPPSNAFSEAGSGTEPKTPNFVPAELD